jgi:hypothetical protein
LEEYCIALPKPITLETPWAKLLWSKLSNGYYLWQGILNAHALPFVGYLINTYLLKLVKVLHNHTKTYNETNTYIKVFNN